MDAVWKRNPAAMHEHVSTMLCERVFCFDTIAQINLYRLVSGHKDFASNEMFPHVSSMSLTSRRAKKIWFNHWIICFQDRLVQIEKKPSRTTAKFLHGGTVMAKSPSNPCFQSSSK